MKIVLLAFPIGKVGGIVTNIQALEKGFNSLGHSVDKFFITTNTKKKPEKNDFGWPCLGFEQEEWLRELKQTVNQYDLVIWEVCCPHETKAYTKTNWKQCFDLQPTQLAYIHDNYYEKYYYWFREIPRKYRLRLVCPYQYMMDSITGLLGMKTIIDNPVDIQNPGLYTESKLDLLVDHNNWKGIKHKEILVKNSPNIEGKVITYGEETLECKMAKQMPEFSSVEDKGWQSRDVIYSDLMKAKVVTDLCKRGNVNHIYDYVISEAVAFGCIPVLQTKICPNHQDIYVEYANENNLFRIVNNIFKNFDEYEERRSNNLKFLERVAPETIAKKLLDYAQQPYKESNENTLLDFLS